MNENKPDAPPATTTAAPPPATAKYLPNVDCRIGERHCIAGSPIEVPYSTEPRASWTPIDEAAKQRFKEAGIRHRPYGSHVSPVAPPKKKKE